MKLIKKLIINQAPLTEAEGNVNFVLEKLNEDLQNEYQRIASLANCYELTFNTCRIHFLKQAIQTIEDKWKTFKSQPKQAMADNLDDFQQSLLAISMQKVGSHCFEDYLVDSQTPFIQVTFSESDESRLPDLAYAVNI